MTSSISCNSAVICNKGCCSPRISPGSQPQDFAKDVRSARNSNVTFPGVGCSLPAQSPGNNIKGTLTNSSGTALLDMSGKNPTLSVNQNDDGAPFRANVASAAKTQPNVPVNIVEPDPVVKESPKPESSKINNNIKTVGKIVSWTVAVLAVAIPVAAAVGFIPVAPFIIAQSVVLVIAVLLCAYAAAKKDMAAILIGSWAMTKAKQVQWTFAALTGWTSAITNGASWESQKFAMGCSYKIMQLFEGWGLPVKGFAISNGAGAAVARVDKKAKEHGIKTTDTMLKAAAYGSIAGCMALKGIEGSYEVGKGAGSGSFHGADIGRKGDMLVGKGANLATAAIDWYWGFLLPDIFAARPEEEHYAEADDRLSHSADLSKHDQSCVTGLVNAYWRFWLNDAVVPSQGSAFSVVHNDKSTEKVRLGKTNKLWSEDRESSPVNHGGIPADNAMPDAQRSRQNKAGTATDDLNPGLGEWLGAHAGAIGGGVYSAVDYRTGGRFKDAASAIGKQVTAVRNFMSTSTVVTKKGNPDFLVID